MKSSLLAACVAALALVPSARANILLNGGFESGFTSWTRADLLGSDGTFFLQSGIASPVNGYTVPAPPSGSTAAMSDGGAAGSHVLYQDFLVPVAVGTSTLSFDLFLGNSGFDYVTPSPADLDFSIAGFNQQARVDILTSSSVNFSVAPGDVLLSIYQTQSGDALVSGYTTISTDVTALLAAHPGETLRLRFAETDNFLALQMGIDNVSLEIKPVPEAAPSAAVVGGVGAAMLAWSRRRSRNTRPAAQ